MRRIVTIVVLTVLLASCSSADSIRDLHALLDDADVAGPYLLVGFSFGGLLAIMSADTYPDQVIGLVSLDGSLPTDQAKPLVEPELVIKEISRILKMA